MHFSIISRTLCVYNDKVYWNKPIHKDCGGSLEFDISLVQDRVEANKLLLLFQANTKINIVQPTEQLGLRWMCLCLSNYLLNIAP